MVLAVEGSPGNAAHFEHIVLVTASGVEILTDLVAARPWSGENVVRSERPDARKQQ